jgi:hypothetical protein
MAGQGFTFGGMIFVTFGFLWSLLQLVQNEMVLTPMDFISTGLGFVGFAIGYIALKPS